ncbi:MAG: hypothetical protein KDC03_01940 [Flavobacteriales bacterium]|nr:hypothetical protein [Flavobacteriales bacterium]
MAGSTPQWKAGTYHYSRWQHWEIPLDKLVLASEGELSVEGDRCTYAADDSAELNTISAWKKKNRAPWRDL